MREEFGFENQTLFPAKLIDIHPAFKLKLYFCIAIYIGIL